MNNSDCISEQETSTPLHGDILELVLSHVPFTDLVLASQVSNSWKLAVTRSLKHFNKPKPWLLIHTQTQKPPYNTTMCAYDPRSGDWIEFISPSIKYVNVLRSSHSELLYMLSPWSFSFSIDPLHLTWHHATAPRAWRGDPIVAVVGRFVVIAGGYIGFEDALMPVEVYNIESRVWSACEDMPSLLTDCDASTWHSIAVDNDDLKLYVSEKHSGVTYGFDPETVTWSGPYKIRPDPNIFTSVIGFANNRMILTGVLGDSQNVVGLKIYEVDKQLFECVEIVEMPIELISRLKSNVSEILSINIRMAENIVYVYNPNEISDIFVCEIVRGGCRWRSVRNVVEDGRRMTEKVVFSCCEVSMEDLKRALGAEKSRLKVVDSESTLS